MINHSASTGNPYDWINPIRDQKIFAGRKEELSKIIDEVTRVKKNTGITPIVAVTGERRVGKTSLLLRIEGKCQEQHIKSIIVPVETDKIQSSWEFWNEIFSRLLLNLKKKGVDITGQSEAPIGFSTEETSSESSRPPTLENLMFPSAYKYYISGARVELSTVIIQNDIANIIRAFQELGYEGLILIFDEAHNLVNSQNIKQQIRNTIQYVAKCGIIFAGETTLTRMFTDPSEPFFGQASIIPLGNFIVQDDIAECCLLPLTADEVKLMSPMTVQYLARLSRGKPNQLRLICSSIYKRYEKGQQDDLNVTIDVLDDVLESITDAYEDPNLRNNIVSIQRLSSVELELLYNMTRYQNWSIQDIIDLDESFRGDSKSKDAVTRRKRCLQEKHKLFIGLELMTDDEERYQLVGGEFVALYLRFFYETQKYGSLSKNVILGKGPPIPFGETTEKLVRSLGYHFGQAPELQTLIMHHSHRDFGDIIRKVERRFSVLEELRQGTKPKGENLAELISECFRTCELIGKQATYYLLCLSVRSRDNPRQVIQVELYFDLDQQYSIDLLSLFNLLNEQAEDARVLIEGYSGFWVVIPDLAGLLKSFGVAFEDFLEKLPLILKWQLSSVQYLVKDKEKASDTNSTEIRGEEEDDNGKWVRLYGKGQEEDAEKHVMGKLGVTEERAERARLYNDLGYIRCGKKLRKYDFGRKDLETAIDLHYSNLQITLLNLSYLDLEADYYEKAIEKIEVALLLSLSPVQTDVTYLRLKLPENHLGFIVNCEQHPANIIEAAYINLAYTILKFQGYEKALEILDEGIELFPNSIRLKHARARFFVYKKRVDLALPIYAEISQAPSLDRYMEFEVKYLQRHILGRKKKKAKSKHKVK